MAKCGSLLLLLVLIPSTACRRTAFEQAQAEAESANPHWLEIALDTAEHRQSYKESETIGFTVAYSSAVRELYKIEVSEESTIIFTDRLRVSNGLVSSMHLYGVVCCSSRTIGLNDEPWITRPQLRLRLKPGIHEMYMTTRRVFPWNITSEVYEPSEWTTASNILKIQVVADPGWQERALATLERTPNDQAACTLLSGLDIPAATQKKLDYIRDHHPCVSRSTFREFNESEYPAALRGMESIVHSPTYGVTQSDVNMILAMRSWMAHPDLRDFPERAEEQERFRQRAHDAFLDNERAFVRELCGTLSSKLSDASAATRQTIDGITANKLQGISPCE